MKAGPSRGRSRPASRGSIRPTLPGGSAPRPSRVAWGAALAVAAITGLAYAGAFDHSFVEWDDPEYVVDNAMVRGHDWARLLRAVVGLNYHPLTMLSLAWNAATPLSPTPMIATNVLLHALNSVLVFWLAHRLSAGRVAVAGLVALIFGLHPSHVESVAWISERKDVLYAFFFLAAAIAYLRHQEAPRGPWLWVAFALFVLSCLSKATAVCFPVVMAALDFWRRRPLWSARGLLEKTPFLLAALLFGLVAVDVQAGGSFHGLLDPGDLGRRAIATATPFSAFQRLALPAYGHMMYLLKFLVPVQLSPFYPYPPPTEAGDARFAIAPLFLLLTVAAALWSARRGRRLAFGLAWYFATVVLVLQWLPVGRAIMADRYTYLPYVGLAFALATHVEDAAGRGPRWRAVLRGASLLYVAILLSLTVRQVEVWRNDEALWTAVIRRHPETEFAYANRGAYRRERGQAAEALSDLRTAVALRSRRPDVFENLAIAYGTLGHLDSALVHFDRAVAMAPDRGLFRYNRALAHLRLGHGEEALADLDRVAPGNEVAPASLAEARGHALLRLGRFRQAAEEFGRAIAGGTRKPSLFYHRGLARQGAADRAGAAQDFRAALSLDPRHEPAREKLRALDAVAH